MTVPQLERADVKLSARRDDAAPDRARKCGADCTELVPSGVRVALRRVGRVHARRQSTSRHSTCLAGYSGLVGPTSLLPLDHSGFWSQFSHHRRAHPSSKSSRKGLEASKRGSQALNLSARPLKTDSGKHFFGAVAVLGARSARKIVNRCHFNRFPRGFHVHVRPAQHHKSRVTQEDGTGERPRRPRRC